MHDGAEVASPCVSVCRMDAATGLCAGCYRTLSEIAAWIDLSPEERRAVIERTVGRRAQYADAMASRSVSDASR